MGEEFNIHLLSNVAPEIFPENKAQDFSTILADEIYLDGRWEVGLQKIMYPTDIASVTKDDKLEFYDYKPSDRTTVSNFKRGRDTSTNQVPINIYEQWSVLQEKMALHKKELAFPKAVNDVLSMNSLYQRSRPFYFDYTEKQKKIIFNVTVDDIVVEMDGLTAHYFGMLPNIFTKGIYWAWRSRTGTKSFGMQTLHFIVEDLTYYEKAQFKMTKEGNDYVCKELGLVLENGKFIDKGNVDYRFFQVDGKTNKQLAKANTYPMPSIYRRKPEHKFLKLNEEDWPTLSPVVTVWYNRLTDGKDIIQPTPSKVITLNEKADLKKADTVLEGLNIHKNTEDYHMSYNEDSHRFKLVVGKKSYVKLSSSLSSILGFGEDVGGKYLLDTTIEAKYFPLLDRGIKTLMLYSNIVEPSFIGDVKAPLLGICAFEKNSNDGHIIQKEFLKPIYVPLNRNIVRHIDISIHDEGGLSVPFLQGKTVLTLHFRRMQHPLY